MVCKTCGINNNPDNKFCTNCGEELIEANNSSENFCPVCGARNETENKFCISCGSKLQNKIQTVLHHQTKNKSKKAVHEERDGKKNKSRKQEIKKLSGISIFWITAGALIAVVLITTTIISGSNSDFNKRTAPIEVKSNDLVVEAKVNEIASKFICSCGTCNNQSLEISKCDVAIEERQLIRSYLEQNRKPDDIVITVANKYGWLKPEFASIYKVDASKIWNPKEKIITKDIIPDNPLTTNSNLQSEPWNTVCPIEGDPVYSGMRTIEYNGKIYGLCCEDCQTEFGNGPEKYSRQLSTDGIKFIRS